MPEMDLPTVKAAVKAWERAFRAKQGRQPTKEDIKADGGGIAEQYTLYRKLTKATQSTAPSSSASAGPSRSSSSQAHRSSSQSQQAGPSRSTPRHVPSSEYPTTPTPPTRRRPIPTNENGQGNNMLKRKASSTELTASPTRSSAMHQLLTPQKSKAVSVRSDQAYTGPIVDPNPVNPFSASPRKSPIHPGVYVGQAGGSSFRIPSSQPGPSGSRLATATSSATASTSTAWDQHSPFIHATTPKKLKEVLAANSLRKVRARLDDPLASPSKSTTPLKDRFQSKQKEADEITPRTKARKRLAGEMLAPTPGKAGPRKRGMTKMAPRGDGGEGSTVPSNGAHPIDIIGDRSDADVGDEDEDEIGPSPMRVDAQRGFTHLLGDAISDDDEAASGTKNRPPHSRATSGKGRPDPTKGIFASRLAASVSKAGVQARPGHKDRLESLTEPDSPFLDLPTPATTAFVSEGRSSPRPVGSQLQHASMIDGRPKPASVLAVADPDVAIQRENASQLEPKEDDIPRLPTPPPETIPDAIEADDPSSVTPSAKRAPTRTRYIQISDDEADEFDPEADRYKRVVIVPTRQKQARRGSLSLSEDEGAEQAELEEMEEDDHPSLSHGTAMTPSDSTRQHTPPHTAEPAGDGFGTTSDIPPHLISTLSLHSPRRSKSRSTASAALRVKALFDPEAQRSLKALQRGQEVVLPGTAVHGSVRRGAGLAVEGLDGQDEEERLLALYGARGKLESHVDYEEDAEAQLLDESGDREDDDWESESEGWKRTGEDMDDW